ncbi:MAG: CHAT domain-containing protein [Caldilineaceae bacterium]
MSNHPLFVRLLAEADLAAKQRLLTKERRAIDEQLIDALKDRADQQLRADAHDTLDSAALLYHAAALTGDPLHRAVALFAEANAWSIGGLGDHQRAIMLCDDAAAIYAQAHRPVDQADAQATKIYALTMLGRHEEALAVAAWAATILEEHQEWLRLATIVMNGAIVYGRMGKDREALTQFARAGALYRRAGDAGLWSLPGVEMNRALVLRNLGAFAASLTANRAAIQLLQELGQDAEVGHAQQTMAFTQYTLGRYNEALALLDEAHTCFSRYDRQADLLVTGLYRAHCLLEMRRFAEVIADSDELFALAERLGQRFEAGYALLNKARALAGLQQQSQAFDLLTAARALFISDGNVVWAAQTALAAGHLLLAMGRWAAALEQANQCAAIFTEYGLPIDGAYAQLLRANIFVAQGAYAVAAHLLRAINEAGQTQGIPQLCYQIEYLFGEIAEQSGSLAAALDHYAAALTQIDLMRGRLMVEHRVDFLTDKETVYAAAVRVALAQGEVATAHGFADRARSRALYELLALRLDLRIQARTAADQPLIDELNQLRQERDTQYRRLIQAQEFAAMVDPTAPTLADAQASAVQPLEARITALWHTLLVRNADYILDESPGELTHAQGVAVDGADLASARAQLSAGTLILSYFVNHTSITLFVLTRDSVTAHMLPTTGAQIQHLVELLRLNCRMAAASDATRLPALLSHAQKILHQLYQRLLAPVAAALQPVQAIIVVPHGPLHYVPFHALVTKLDLTRPTQSVYLLDRYAVSYLPGVRFLAHKKTGTRTHGDHIAFGHSYSGRLPHAVAEAQTVAALTSGRAFVEGGVTKARLQEAAATAHLLHIATHGEFRADNPLFSGLALADGWFSTPRYLLPANRCVACHLERLPNWAQCHRWR